MNVITRLGFEHTRLQQTCNNTLILLNLESQNQTPNFFILKTLIPTINKYTLLYKILAVFISFYEEHQFLKINTTDLCSFF